MSARNTPRKTVLKMTKGHFQFIAKVLRDFRPVASDGQDATAQWDTVVQGFADMLGQTNPNFDRQTFIKACREP